MSSAVPNRRRRGSAVPTLDDGMGVVEEVDEVEVEELRVLSEPHGDDDGERVGSNEHADHEGGWEEDEEASHDWCLEPSRRT